MVGVLGVFVGCSPTTILPKPDSNHCVSSVSLYASQDLKSLLPSFCVIHMLIVLLDSMVEGRRRWRRVE
jgi:hypothetical protein